MLSSEKSHSDFVQYCTRLVQIERRMMSLETRNTRKLPHSEIRGCASIEILVRMELGACASLVRARSSNLTQTQSANAMLMKKTITLQSSDILTE